MAAALSYVSRFLILVLLLTTTWDPKSYYGDSESGGSLFLAFRLDAKVFCGRNSTVRRVSCQDILSVSSKLRAGICLTEVGLSAVYLLMLAGDVSKNPGPSWNTNLQNSTNSVDDILNGEPNFDDIADEMHDCTLESNNEYCNPEEFFDLGLGAKGIRFGNWNINHLTMEKFDQLKLFLWNRSRPQVDVFALNETFLKPEVPDSLYFIPGFTLYRRDRVGSRKGGGVIVYVNDELNFKRRTDLENSELEVIWLEVCPFKSKRPILFGTIYRPPSYNKDMDLKLQRNLEAVYPLNKETILIGDFNLDYFKTASKRNILMKALSGMEFKQLINCVTRPISGTCLDHIFSNRPERITNVKTLESSLADHFPVLAVRLYKAKFCSRLKNKHVTINYRSMKFFDANRFVN